MFCIKCGTKNHETVKFCVNCGQQINTDNTAEVKDTVPNNVQSLTTKTRKSIWKILMKIVLILILIPLIISAAVLTYQWYQDLPQPVTQLGLIKLGMKPVDVTLALGKPSQETTIQNKVRYTYTIYGDVTRYLITFNELTEVSQICSEDYSNDVLGLSIYDDEKQVINKLGEPSKVSIDKAGLMKLISYSQYNIAFGIKEGNVSLTCVTASEMSFVDEYK